MNAMNPLDQLKDIQLPDPVSWWPLAFGWWVIIFAVIALIALSVIWHQQQRWKKRAVQQLSNITPRNEQTCYYQINRVLKQVAIHRFGAHAAPLSGEAWLAFLDSKVKQPIFLPALVDFAYAPDNPEVRPDADHIIRLAKQWIRKHKC